MDEPAQPAEGQDQQVAQPTPPAAPAVPMDAPWSNDLAQMFPDESVRGTVDQYLRSKVQPHTTKLEQELAASKDAMELWSALSNDETVVPAYLQITEELVPEHAAAIKAMLEGQQRQQETQEQAAPPQLSEEDRAALDYARKQRLSAEYEENWTKTVESHKDTKLDRRLFDESVAICEGDFTKAYDHYVARLEHLKSIGLAPQEVEPAADPPAPVIGSDVGTAASSTASKEQRYASFGDAIDAMLAEDRAKRGAPPVGTA